MNALVSTIDIPPQSLLGAGQGGVLPNETWFDFVMIGEAQFRGC